VRVLNDEVLAELGLSAATVDRVTEVQRRELEHRERAYRGRRAPLEVRGKTAIVVDDGVATGSSMRAAVAGLRRLKPARLVVAVPVGARATCQALEAEADETICALTPDDLDAVGLWYQDFTQTTDEEVRALLEAAASAPSRPPLAETPARE